MTRRFRDVTFGLVVWMLACASFVLIGSALPAFAQVSSGSFGLLTTRQPGLTAGGASRITQRLRPGAGAIPLPSNDRGGRMAQHDIKKKNYPDQRPTFPARDEVPPDSPAGNSGRDAAMFSTGGVLKRLPRILFQQTLSDLGDAAGVQADSLVVPSSYDTVATGAQHERPFDLPDPAELPLELPEVPAEREDESQLVWRSDPPAGYSGKSGILPTESQQDSHFVPVEDRWRLGFPSWDRYGNGNPPLDDAPYEIGRLLNPYNQNVLKGDYPIVGQHTFLKLTAQSFMLHEVREVPTPTTPFEATRNPGQAEFFGDPNQYFYNHNFVLAVDLFHGDTSFKPADWRIKVSQVFNLNYLDVEELAVVNPNVLDGTTRARQDYALEEWFVEAKLADLSPNYDFASVRAGSQLFVSDFRGFIFSDINRAVRLFGTRLANRDQFNLIWFDQTEKETNSLLNTFDDRQQNTLIANYYRQDFLWPGYTTQLSFHYNHDRPTTKFDKNDFLVRPDPVGIFAPHDIQSYYFGWAGNGHINRYNISHALYYVCGHDDLNPLAGRPVDISALMAAVELSYDRDWVRFRTSYFYSSGDRDINDDRAEGFDAIFDNPAFAGGEFSYWQRQAVPLFGVNLTNRLSLVPNLRSSKFQGQTNFVNPGLHLVNVGMDADVTPRLKLIGNANFLWFDEVNSLETYLFQSDVDRYIGADLSLGVEYRPWHSNNWLLVGGVSGLLTGQGFDDLYERLDGESQNYAAGFLECILEY